MLKRGDMVCPPASLSPRRSTVAAFLLALAVWAPGCAPGVGGEGASLLASPAPAAEGRSRVVVAVVTIDAGATLELTPGEGVGLFVQYAEGGHWNLSTTCDTRTSGQPCAFDVLISPAPEASFSGVEGRGLSRDDRLELRPDGSVRLVTSTSFGTDGMSFDSEPGAIVEVDALLDGLPQPRFVYVVSEGAAVEGVPTNPVAFSPSAP